jgi:hypothetical protein
MKFYQKQQIKSIFEEKKILVKKLEVLDHSGPLELGQNFLLSYFISLRFETWDEKCQ